MIFGKCAQKSKMRTGKEDTTKKNITILRNM